MSSNRRRSRELALQVLFQQEFLKNDIKENLKLAQENLPADKEIWQYAEKLILGVCEHNQILLDKLKAVSSNWKPERMALVDLSLLKIASYELLYCQDLIPAKVAIDEALEIAKVYSSADSSQFINGLLDQILKEIH